MNRINLKHLITYCVLVCLLSSCKVNTDDEVGNEMDIDIGMGEKMTMVKVEGGTISEGDSALTVKTFWIAKYELTIRQCKAIIDKVYSEDDGDVAAGPFTSAFDKLESDYCTLLSKKTGKKFRYPTKTEWIFAARGGLKTHHYKYAGSDSLELVAWFDEGDDEPIYIHKVGQKMPNELGIYDMSGNVSEWSSDNEFGTFWIDVDRTTTIKCAVLMGTSFFNSKERSELTYYELVRPGKGAPMDAGYRLVMEDE